MTNSHAALQQGTTPGDYSPLAVIVDECAQHGFVAREILWSCRLLILGYLVGRERDLGILQNKARLRKLVRDYLGATHPSGGSE